MIQYDQFIQYGNAKHGAEFQRLNDRLKQIAFIASIVSFVSFGEKLITTSIYRKKTENTSNAHEHYIAVDFAPLSTIEKTYRIIEIINFIYTYDEKRPGKKVALPPYHGTNPHIHLQAREFTVPMTECQMGLLTSLAVEDKSKFTPKPIA